MLGDKLNTSRFTCSGPLIFGGGHPLQIPNVVIPAGSADIFRSYLGSTSILGFQQGSVNIGMNPDGPFALNSVSGNVNIFNTNISKHIGFFSSDGSTMALGGNFKSLASSNNITGVLCKQVGVTIVNSAVTHKLDAAAGYLTGTWFYNGTPLSLLHSHSDARIKRCIIPIEGALDKVSKLNGVSFRWNKDYAETRRDLKTKIVTRNIGFIAQEVEEVVPEVISTEKVDGIDFDIKKVDYGKMVALLTEAIKEQQIQIESMKEEITNLKNQLNN
jgi:hypothetical protein|tara:strand:- start:2055 stop:2873 length:819 start_codon:yes stop_codon:yes gene_type:complete